MVTGLETAAGTEKSLSKYLGQIAVSRCKRTTLRAQWLNIAHCRVQASSLQRLHDKTASCSGWFYSRCRCDGRGKPGGKSEHTGALPDMRGNPRDGCCTARQEQDLAQTRWVRWVQMAQEWGGG